jgi:MFS transporter, NRE family, putaive nickel resistance protein
VYVRDELHRGGGSFAWAMVAVGVGSSLAALLLARIAGRTRARSSNPAESHLAVHRWGRRSLILGGAALSLSLLPGVLVPGLGLLLLLWGLNGAGQALVSIPSMTLLAEHTAAEERGRAYAAHFALTHLFWLLTYPAVGYLARGIGTPRTFGLAGAFCGVLTLAALAIRTPHRSHPLADG